MLDKYTFYGPNDGSSRAYALEHNGHTIAMLTASRTRHNKQFEWQVMNYIELNSLIVGNGFDALVAALASDV